MNENKSTALSRLLERLKSNKKTLLIVVLSFASIALIVLTVNYGAAVNSKLLKEQVLGIETDSSMTMEVPNSTKDNLGNYIFPLGPVEVLLVLTTGSVNKVESVEAIVHYDPTVISAQSVDFNQTISTQYLTQDLLKCNPIHIEKDAQGNETGTITLARTSVPLPDSCPNQTSPTNTGSGAFPTYNPIPINTSGGFARIRFNTLRNTTVPFLISYEMKPFFPNPTETLNDSNVSTYIEPSARTGNAYDVLQRVSNLSFVVGTQPTPTPTPGTSPTPTPTPTPEDTTPPTVDITNPTVGSTVTGVINITANASDNVAISKVDFSVDGVLKCSDNLAPYSCSWNSATSSNGPSHTITVKAFDTALPVSNTDTESVTVSICNGDCESPTAPTNLISTNTTYNNVSLSWTASKDNVSVSGYVVYRKKSTETTFTQLSTTTTASYTDNSVSASTQYNYQVKAFDNAQNYSAASNVLTVTTPTGPDVISPNPPSNLNGTAVSTSQINLSWVAATDNAGGSGIAGYNVYRSTTGITGAYSKVNQSLVESTSFGNTGLAPSTDYSYKVTAVDRANNESAFSNTITVRTQNQTISTGRITGVVTSAATRAPLSGVKVSISSKNVKVSAVTDSSGSYTLSNLPPALYSVKYTLSRFTSLTIQVRVLSGQTTTQNVEMGTR